MKGISTAPAAGQEYHLETESSVGHSFAGIRQRESQSGMNSDSEDIQTGGENNKNISPIYLLIHNQPQENLQYMLGVFVMCDLHILQIFKHAFENRKRSSL